MSKLIDISKINTILNKIKTYINNKLSSLVINSDLIADGAITASKIGGEAITQDKIASSVNFLDNNILNLGFIHTISGRTIYVTISKYLGTKDIVFSFVTSVYDTTGNYNVNIHCKYLYSNIEKSTTVSNVYFDSDLTWNVMIVKIAYNNGDPIILLKKKTSLSSYDSSYVPTDIYAVEIHSLAYVTPDIEYYFG